MDLINLLKKLKSIEPNGEFTRNSRRLILATRQGQRINAIMGLILKNLEMGASLALAGLLIFMIFGGFTAWKLFTPLEFSNLDPSGLKAEAQAIDIQIQLTNLNYNESSILPKLNESTNPLGLGQEISNAESSTKTVNVQENTAPTAQPNSNTLTIDEALQRLSE